MSDSARWLTSRARNAMRRPAPILALGGIVFVGIITAFLIVPYQRDRTARSLAPRPEERPDTVSLRAALARADTAVASAEAALETAREEMLRPAPPPVVVDTLPPRLVARRDSLAAVARTLSRSIERVETAPLPASFRALGELPSVSRDPRARILLDSLEDVEREREVFGAAGGVDPIYVALTSRATALGRAIRAVAEDRLRAVRGELEALRPPPPPQPPPRVSIDTMPLLERRARVVAVHDSALAALTAGRERNLELDRRAAEAQRLASVGAPAVAILVAATVLALATGFALALALEFRRPHVADAREVERLSGVRVLGVIRPHAPPPHRARRRADLLAPPLIVPTDETYRRLHLHLSAAGVPLVLLTGPEPTITGIIGANIAAMAAYEARIVLLVDADLEHCTLAGVFRGAPAPGLAEILAGRAQWAEAAVATTIGRDRAMFVISSGDDAPPLTDELRRTLREGLERMARRYDVVVVVTSHPPGVHVGMELLPIPDVVYCAEVGRTPLANVMRAVREMQETGAHVRGIVLWEMEIPELPSREQLSWMRSAAGAGAATPVRAGTSS